MDLKMIYKNAHCVVLEIEDGGTYETSRMYCLYLSGKFIRETGNVVTSIYDLKSGASHQVEARNGEGLVLKSSLTTDSEFITLDVRDFGVKEDGIQDDTLFIQVTIMTCPERSRVLIPVGIYRIVSLSLKDDVSIELAEGVVLFAHTDRTRFPVFQGMIQSYGKQGGCNLGIWEGNPLPMFIGVINDMNVRGAVIHGQGTIDGSAGDSEGNWWREPKVIHMVRRPRMTFLERCRQVMVQGITVRNSPSWNIHPYFSNHLKFLDLKVLNPKDSPNTDRLDPESCQDTGIAGVYFSLGDDCIAVESGKIYMGSTYKQPSKDVSIRGCCMRDGHGSVTIGSEMAGGVKNLTVKDCMLLHMGKGLCIKTRRGQGKDAVVDGTVFEYIRMSHAMTPFVISCFYFCDPDGHSEYVRTKEAPLADERIPLTKSLYFGDTEAENCHIAAAYMYGLPEQRVEWVEMDYVRVTYVAPAREGQPAVMDGCSSYICRMGIYANQIEELILTDVKVEGQDGPVIIMENIGRVRESI